MTNAQPVRPPRVRPQAEARTVGSAVDADASSPSGSEPAVLPRFEPPAGFTTREVAQITGGRMLRDSSRAIRGAAVDSRLIQPGELFVALPGERTDGHHFLKEAVAAGAGALLVSRAPSRADQEAVGGAGLVLVPDGVRALGLLAGNWRTRFSPLVVGVTGSVAKTSTKEAIAAVLGRRFTTLRNEGNQNNEIGLPLTVLRLGPEHEAAVLEMGMYAGGEIAELASIARPRIGVVTAVLGVHLSRLGSIDAIERAKGELVESLPSDGTAVLNADDERVRRMASRTSARSLSYGFAADADVGAEGIESLGAEGMRFTLRVAGERQTMTTPALGRHAVHNALAAAAVGFAAGMGIGDVATGIGEGWWAPHRGELIRAGDLAIIDDSYNASPVSVRAALELLASLPGRHVAVLGEMRELGDQAAAAHREVGTLAAASSDLLVVVGREAAAIGDGARAAGLDPGSVLLADDRDAALALLLARLEPRDVVLVKASRGVELDLLVDALRAELDGGAVRGSLR